MAPMDPGTSGGDRNPSALVLIIASAGSSDPLHLLASRLTPGHATAYLVVRHASEDTPDEDLLNSLAACSLLPVSTLKQGEPPAANWLQLLPVGMELQADGLAIWSREPGDRLGAGLNLDTILETLAAVWGPRLIVIVLSGLGADGVLGLWRVLDTGGQVAALNPRSALFSGMPSADIQLGGLTAVLDPAGISDWLHQQLSNLESQKIESSLTLSAELLQHILMVLHERTGVDFSRYKTSTVCRQLQRRLALLKLDNFNDYLRMLQADDLEPEQLKAHLLVGVTRFFREGSPFAALRTELESLMANRIALQPLRVWVPGCSSGEEAYSIAMLVSALLDHPADLSDRLKIFATDLNDNALAVARRGQYPSACADAVPIDLRQRYISLRDDQIEISRELRRCIVFSRHNLGSDPPFPRLDLISCRNTLIYFNSSLQEQALRSFRFALVPGGLLLLGQSESLPPGNRGFATVNAQQRLYRLTSHLQRDDLVALNTQPFGSGAVGLRRQTPHRRDHPASQHVELLEALVQQRQPPTLILDENLDLIAVLGDVTPFCGLPQGPLITSVTGFLREELRAEATALLLLSRNDGAVRQSRALRLGDDQEPVMLEVASLQVEDRSLRCLSFHRLPASDPTVAPPLSLELNQEMARLESELLRSQNSLRESMAELEQANEELEASAEELQASSEELQASNEELESSIEELQATNAELVALNQELQRRGEELEQVNLDLQNIQCSLSQGMVIVDQQLRVLRFSPLAVRVFGLLESDRGLPLLDVPTTLPLQGLADALRAVVNGAPQQQLEANSEEVSYLLRVLPYLGPCRQLMGAIITLTDVSELVALRRVAEASLAGFISLTDALDEVVWKRDPQLEQLLYVSRQAGPILGRPAAELLADPGWLDRQITAEDRQVVLAARQRPGPGWSVQYRWRHPEGRVLQLLETALRLDGDLEASVVGTLRVVEAQPAADR
jgi:two-component system CheB/CheR fusion protein